MRSNSKTEAPINITSDLKDNFDSVNKAPSDACQLALKQPIPGKQLVLMTDASFGSAGYALMIEDTPDRKLHSKRKTYAPWRLAQSSLPCTTQDVHILKRIFGNLHGIFRVCTYSVGSNKANNSLNRQQVRHPFFPNKGNPATTLEGM